MIIKKYIFIIFFFSSFSIYCQLTVNTVKNLSFGTFCKNYNSSGTISISPLGIRSSTGGVYLLNLSHNIMSAEIELLQCDNYNVIITYSNSTLLTNGTNNIVLNIGPTNIGTSGSSILTQGDCDFSNLISIGGTLTIPSNTSIGNYNGSFSIIFNNE